MMRSSATERFFWILLALLCGAFAFILSTRLFLVYAWLDIPLHFLGGIVAALYLTLFFERELRSLPRLGAAFMRIAGTVFVGVAWEFLEWLMAHTLSNIGPLMLQPGLDDTLLDLLMDFAGGTLVALFLARRKEYNG